MTKIYIGGRLLEKAHTANPTGLPFKELTGDIEWMERAACRGSDTSIFFPERGEDTKLAIRLHCTPPDGPPCSVRNECFAYALDNQQSDGIWGGHGIKNRRRFAQDFQNGKSLEEIERAAQPVRRKRSNRN